MRELTFGQLKVRVARNMADHCAVQALRNLVFRNGFDDADRFDDICTHVLIESLDTGEIACCFRLLVLENGSAIATSYSAQYYDLSAFTDVSGPMIELGRFCVRPGQDNPDILRAAWAALASYVDDTGAEMLFGCASFAGIEETAYLDTFSLLHERYLAPQKRCPAVKSPQILKFSERLRPKPVDLKAAFGSMPPLLRTYISMGAWVSDHAVVDCKLNTLHVFTGLEIDAIPPSRARLLRSIIETGSGDA